MTLRAVIFDAGDVLIRTVDYSLRAAWEERLHLAPGAAERLIFGAETGSALQTGRISDAEHWRRLGARLGLDDAGLARFRADFFAHDQLDAELLAYIRRLRRRYHVGLLSNAPDSARRLLGEKFGILDCFDSVTISAEEGVMKPDPRIFEIALARAGARPDEALFVDDSARNIEAAQRLGMLTLHYTDSEVGRRALPRLTGVPYDEPSG